MLEDFWRRVLEIFVKKRQKKKASGRIIKFILFSTLLCQYRHCPCKLQLPMSLQEKKYKPSKKKKSKNPSSVRSWRTLVRRLLREIFNRGYKAFFLTYCLFSTRASGTQQLNTSLFFCPCFQIRVDKTCFWMRRFNKTGSWRLRSSFRDWPAHCLSIMRWNCELWWIKAHLDWKKIKTREIRK